MSLKFLSSQHLDILRDVEEQTQANFSPHDVAAQLDRVNKLLEEVKEDQVNHFEVGKVRDTTCFRLVRAFKEQIRNAQKAKDIEQLLPIAIQVFPKKHPIIKELHEKKEKLI